MAALASLRSQIMAGQRSPSDFDEVFSSTDLPLIVGGQAVNLWAEVFETSSPGLRRFYPFLSRDADIVGNRESAEALAKKIGWQCRFINEKDSMIVAILTRPGTESDPLTLDVLQEVNGLTPADLAINEIVEMSGQTRYRIPAPVVLLRSKLYNLVSLVYQERPQDLRHAQMLLEIVPAYLREIHSQHLLGKVSQETVVGALDYTRRLIGEGFASNAVRKHGLDFSVLIPADVTM